MCLLLIVSGQRISVKGCIACHAVIEVEWSILQNTPQQRLGAFLWAGKPSKFPLPMGDLDPHLIHGPHESAPKCLFYRFSGFCGAYEY